MLNGYKYIHVSILSHCNIKENRLTATESFSFYVKKVNVSLVTRKK